MGMTIAVAFDADKYDGKLFTPRCKLVPFPAGRCKAPGQLVTYFSALPSSSKQPPSQDNLYWWVDCQFMPFRDHVLCCSVGVYERRMGRTPVSLSPFVKGLIYTMNFNKRMSCSVIKGTSSSAMPKVNPHPQGSKICYIGTGCVTLMDLETMNAVVKHKDMRNSNFRFASISPNGIYIGVLGRVSQDFELGILVIDFSFLLMTERYECHLICPGFRGTRQYTEEVECKFSPDSKYVAVSSSMGFLFVVSRGRQKNHIIIIGLTGKGMFSVNNVKLSSPRAYDFDPRYFHRILTFAGTDNKVYICDIINQSVISQIDMEEEDIECLQYNPRGPILAVANTEAKVRIFSPDSCEQLYVIDAAAQGLEASMQPFNGFYPSILRMSFSKSGEHMVMSSTDGIIRVWQLYPDLSLEHISRKTILQCVRCCDIPKLPLPSKLILYLLEWPTLE